MSGARGPTIAKRQRERAREERRRMKAEKRASRKAEKDDESVAEPGDEDPDIAGIVPGPQPPLEDEFF